MPRSWRLPTNPGCDFVLSEDMADCHTYGTVTVRNPFAVIRDT